jgi:lipoprotein signal peptidase
MLTPFSRILLWLFVMNLGIAFGAGLYEHRIVVPHWLTSSPDGALHWNADAVQQDDTGRRFWAFVTTGPLTLLTLASLIIARKTADPLRRWWLASAGLSLLDRIFTFVYFIPAMVGLMHAADSAESVAAAVRWSSFNYLRHVIVLAAWILALKAFSSMSRVNSRF